MSPNGSGPTRLASQPDPEIHSSRGSDGLFDPIATKRLGPVEGFIRFPENIIEWLCPKGMEHGEAGTEGQHAGGTPRMRDGKPFQTGAHALDGEPPVARDCSGKMHRNSSPP